MASTETSPPASATDVEFFWDPMCPWAWLTSRWVVEVSKQTGLSVNWRFICLRLLNEHKNYDTDFPDRYIAGHGSGLKLLRVAAAIRDHEGIATGELIPPPAGPWDDCFTDVVAQPKLSWSRGPSIEVTANVDHWVIYDEAVHALCAEPQSGPPNGFNLEPRLVEPGSPLITTMTWSW